MDVETAALLNNPVRVRFPIILLVKTLTKSRFYGKEQKVIASITKNKLNKVLRVLSAIKL